MKKRFALIGLFLALLLSAANAQTELLASNAKADPSLAVSTASVAYFSFASISQDEYARNISADLAGTHFLGDAIAKKFYLFKTTYSYKEAIAPGSFATKTIFRKPEIFRSVKKIDSYLKDEVKKGLMTVEEARKEYDKVLEVALNVISEDTGKFEYRLSSVNGNAAKLLKIFVDEVELKAIN